jgi:hypothetical protein
MAARHRFRASALFANAVSPELARLVRRGLTVRSVPELSAGQVRVGLMGIGVSFPGRFPGLEERGCGCSFLGAVLGPAEPAARSGDHVPAPADVHLRDVGVG